eukprot:82507-Pelagomonas_calceolata.AAC.2
MEQDTKKAVTPVLLTPPGKAVMDQAAWAIMAIDSACSCQRRLCGSERFECRPECISFMLQLSCPRRQDKS